MKLFRNILIATSALAIAAACQPAQEEGKGDATIGFDSPTYVYTFAFAMPFLSHFNSYTQ